MEFPGGSVGKVSTYNAVDTGGMGSILGLGRFPGGRHDYLLPYSCPENPMNRGAWLSAVQEVTKIQTWLYWLSMQAKF